MSAAANTEHKPGMNDWQTAHHDFGEPPPRPPDKEFNRDYRRPPDEGFRQSTGGFSDSEPNPGGEQRRDHIDFTGLFIFIMIVALGIAIEITHEWRLTEQRAMLAETGKATAELSFLKAQINPHFLFNTLNNIYALAVSNSGHTADSIMKLSNIMRYVTDEISEDFVPLQNELDCINDYIELQRLRTGSKTQIDFSVTGQPENRNIAPLILMTFVENMFKHGVSKQKEYKLQIKITIEKNSISLFCRNPIFSNKESANRKGIGISNTKQRLEQIYPGKYVLNISNENELYTVNLTLHT